MGLPRFVGQLDKDYLGLLRFKVSRALVVEKREGTRQAEEDEAGTINVYPALKRWASLIRRPSPVGTAERLPSLRDSDQPACRPSFHQVE